MLLYFYCIQGWVWNVVWISILTHFWLTLCEKCQSFSGPYFPAFGLNTERYPLSLFYIQSECGKIRTRKTPNTDNFPAVQCSHFVSSKDTKANCFFGVFRGYKMETMTRNGLMTYKVSNANNINIFRNKMTSIFQEVNKNIPQLSR